jgi:hypothetical protein
MFSKAFLISACARISAIGAPPRAKGRLIAFAIASKSVNDLREPRSSLPLGSP